MPTLALDCQPIIPANMGVSDRAMFDRRLSPKAKLIVHTIARLADEDGAVAMNTETLLSLCGLRDKKTLFEGRMELERGGYMVTDRNATRIYGFRLIRQEGGAA